MLISYGMSGFLLLFMLFFWGFSWIFTAGSIGCFLYGKMLKRKLTRRLENTGSYRENELLE
jgi:uncharacterized BrkB/YihY/UPF0761 family membrane protein